MKNKLLFCVLLFLIEFTISSETILSIPFKINERNRIEVEAYVENSLRKLEFATGIFPSILLDEVKEKTLINDGEDGVFNITERIITSKVFYTTELKFIKNENIKFGIVFINQERGSAFFSEDGILGLVAFSNKEKPLEINCSTKRINLLTAIPEEYKKSYPLLMEYNAIFVILNRNGHDYKMKICTEMDTDMVFPPINGKYGFIGINAMKNYDTVFDFSNNTLWFKEKDRSK